MIVIAATEDPRLLGFRKMMTRLGGARLCFGEPVRTDDRVVIPVARVRGAGGGGFGSGIEGDGGGGGGGVIDAAPIGFIDIGPEGSRFQAIPDPLGTALALRVAAGAFTTLVAGAAGARALRRRRAAALSSPRRLLKR